MNKLTIQEVPVVISFISKEVFNPGEKVYFKGYHNDGVPQQVDQCDRALSFNGVDCAATEILTLVRMGYTVAIEEL